MSGETAVSDSERNFVVHIGGLAGAGQRGLALARDARAARSEIAVRGLGAATAAGIEHGELRVETLQHDFGRIAVLPVFILPFARLQSTFEVNLRAFLEILLGDLGQAFAEDDDAMPFGLLSPFAGVLVAPGFRSRDPQIDDRPAVLCAANFRVGSEIADENDLVDATRHDALRVAIDARWLRLKPRRSPFEGRVPRAPIEKPERTLNLAKGAT